MKCFYSRTFFSQQKLFEEPWVGVCKFTFVANDVCRNDGRVRAGKDRCCRWLEGSRVSVPAGMNVSDWSVGA